MQSITLGTGNIESSRLAYGCMRLVGDGSAAARERGRRAVRSAVDAGFTLFDHADIYGDGECESLFGEVLAQAPGLRDRIRILTKCGIRKDDGPKRYDFSAAHIRASVEDSLRRLDTDVIDVLLLHRPDYLADYEEVAGAFRDLHAAGKVREFGVSNFAPSQVASLQQVCEQPLIVHQVEINQRNLSTLYDGTLEQCRQLNMTPQAWSPLAGAVGDDLEQNPNPVLREELARQAEQHGCTVAGIALAWLMRVPVGISPVIGSTDPERMSAAAAACDISYSREDWYRLLEARNGQRVP